MQIKEYLYLLNDLVYRAILKLFEEVNPSQERDTSLSDSEKTSYIRYVKKVNMEKSSFSNFRRDYRYRMILEHVNKKQGEEYLFKLSKYSSNLTQFQDKAISLSRIGNPRVFHYESLGKVSPTILRYLATAAEINHLFDFKDSNIVTEIGIGYAGQLATLSSIISISEYNAYDLACVQELSKNFLSESGEIESSRLIVCKDIYNVESHESDLFISNYAFSELPIQIQEEYLLKLATKSEYGYMIMNSGLVNRTGRSSGKMSVQMIRDIIPTSKVYPESPLTGPDNYLLTWGNTRDPIL